MNQISLPNKPGAIAERLMIPELPAPVAQYERFSASDNLDWANWDAATPDERETIHPPLSRYRRPPMITAEQAALTDLAARAHADLMAPVRIETLMAWLGPVNGASRNPQPAEDFAARCWSLHEMLGDLPGGVFTAAARRRLGGFFPGSDDIRAAVAAEQAALQLRERVLAAALAGWKDGVYTRPTP